MNVRGVNYLRQTEIHTAHPLTTNPSSCEIETATEKFKLLGIDQIPAESTEAATNISHFEIHKLTDYIWKKK